MWNFSVKWEELIALLKQNRSEGHCWLQKVSTFGFPRIQHLIQGLGRAAGFQLNQADFSHAGILVVFVPPATGACLLLWEHTGPQSTASCFSGSPVGCRDPFFAGSCCKYTRQFLVPALLLRRCASLGLLSHESQILSSTLMLFVTSLDFHLMPLSLI